MGDLPELLPDDYGAAMAVFYEEEGARIQWKMAGQPWRWKPEISEERKAALTAFLEYQPDSNMGEYQFSRRILTRADVEWLLATHEDGRGPVDWNDPSQRRREGLDLRGAVLNGEDLRELPLAGLIGGRTAEDDPPFFGMAGIGLEKAKLDGAQLQGANLNDARLVGASLVGADLQGARLGNTSLMRADLTYVHLQGANLWAADLSGASLVGAFFSEATELNKVTLTNTDNGSVRLSDVHWGDTNLAVVEWEQLTCLGDEEKAWKKAANLRKVRRENAGWRMAWEATRDAFEYAVRGSRQLTVALRAQGLNEHADRFAYRAQVLQQELYRLKKQWGQWLVSHLLAALSGYGYRVRRILVAYGIALTFFAVLYVTFGALFGPRLEWYQALLVSLTAIHGRVFFEQFGLNSPLSWAAAVESVFGIVIEGVFVAMLVQRFFSGR